MNWQLVTQLAQQHGVVPQVYRATGDGSVPDRTLVRQYQASARQALWLTAELLRILKKFEEAGVQVLSYKGPVLAEMLYGDVSMRQFSDLDLLVCEDDVSAIKRPLAEIGYECGLKLTPCQQRAYLKSGYEYTFDGPHGRNLIEIQWQILPRFYSVQFDVTDLFASAIEATVNSVPVRTLSYEDLFLVLCVHAAKHAWARLCWLCDLVELSKRREMDWAAIEKRVRSLGMQRIVAVAFLLAQRLLLAPLPEALERLVASNHAAEAIASEVISRLAAGEEYDLESPAYFRLMLRSRERWQDRARFLWRLGVTPSVGEWTAMRLPDPLFPLYRVVRIGRLAKRIARR
ncbi:MAG TPA: nucleotidyltransferase family protein [Terriglobales bacterium]|nr:nucleotidyltransferase family protein [Terriglobales bacterium]